MMKERGTKNGGIAHLCFVNGDTECRLDRRPVSKFHLRWEVSGGSSGSSDLRDLVLDIFLLASSIGMTIFPGQSGRDPCFHILRSSAFISLILLLSSFRSGNSSTFITSGGLSRVMTSPGAAPSSLRSKLSKRSASQNETESYLIDMPLAKPLFVLMFKVR